MPYSPENSAIKMTPALEAALNKASGPEEMKDLLHQAAIEQALVIPDIYDASNLIPTAKATAAEPQRFAKVYTVDGVKHVIEGDSELDLARKETEFFRTMQQPTTTETTETARTQGRADEIDANEVYRRSQLELAFKRGEISTADYLAQSGAIESYLQDQGIPMDVLKETIQEKSNTRYEQSWASATEEFKNGPGKDWPGGPQNLRKIGELIQQMGNENAEDKVGALAAAYRHMRENGLVAPNHEAEGLRKLAEAKTPEEIRDIAVAMHGGNSSIFGGRY